MTIARFNALIDTYQEVRKHTQWVMRNLDAPAIQTPKDARAAFTAAQDQEIAALREVIEGAKQILVKE